MSVSACECGGERGAGRLRCSRQGWEIKAPNVRSGGSQAQARLRVGSRRAKGGLVPGAPARPCPGV